MSTTTTLTRPTVGGDMANMTAGWVQVSAERRAALFDDVRMLIDSGTPYDQVATRLGMSHAALERLLYRWNKPLRVAWRDTGPNPEHARSVRDGIAAKVAGITTARTARRRAGRKS